MEHRNGSRMVAQFRVGLWQKSRYLGEAEVTNLSAGGLFLSLPEAVRVEAGVIQLALRKPGDSHYQDRLLKALVVHRQAHGCGLMWADFEVEQAVAISAMAALAA